MRYPPNRRIVPPGDGEFQRLLLMPKGFHPLVSILFLIAWKENGMVLQLLVLRIPLLILFLASLPCRCYGGATIWRIWLFSQLYLGVFHFVYQHVFLLEGKQWKNMP